MCTLTVAPNEETTSSSPFLTFPPQIVEMLVSRLALVDALCAPTAELRGQHRCVVLLQQ